MSHAPCTNPRPPHNQSGLTLIEILVALLVLSIGLLGMARLQAASLRANHNAYLRSQAVVLAYDMADRMRANRPPALAGAYDIALAGSASGSTVAADDLAEWKNLLQSVLPSGDGAVDVDGTAATITVQWDDTRGEEDPVQLTVTTEI